MALLLSRTHLHGENNRPQSSKVGSTAIVLIISHITFGDCHVHIFPTTILQIAVYGIFIT